MKKTLIMCIAVLFILTSTALTQTKDLMIPHSQFKPGDSDAEYNLNVSYCYIKDTSTYGFFMAPVILPDGAKIVRMVVYFEDTGAGDIDVTLYDYNLYSDTYTYPFDLNTLGSTSGLRSQSTTGYCKIKNGGHQYTICVYFDLNSRGSGYQLHAVKLIYNE